MSLSLQLGYPNVPKSITNPNVDKKDALDVNGPISFLTFIKIINASFEPDTLQNYYNFYLKTWNNINTNSDISDTVLIVNKYRDFLKDISLHHSSYEEKRFLSLIDFNDPYDLDIAIGFYSKKLLELSKFYNSKRHDVKFNIVRNKLKGTNYGSEKTILELTLSYLKNLEDGSFTYNYDQIVSKLEIEIEELYDTYPYYFNQIPNSNIYDNKDLDYGYDIFLKSNTELISDIFSGISEELQSIKEVDQLFDNKRKLTQKYIATDFYYLSTGSTVTDFISGKLFESDNSAKNLRNVDYPTTASTENVDHFKVAYDIGFFKPSKTSIALVDGGSSTFSVNTDNLKPNTLYYFPDPTIFGDNGKILTFIVDDSALKRNFSSGNAVNQPISRPNDTKYYGYVSNVEPSKNKYLDEIFESGFIQDIKRDNHNNIFGLFKNDHRFTKTIEYVDTPSTYNMLFNGHLFYDDLYWEGYGFDYTIEDSTTFNQTTRSGLSSNTGDFTNLPNRTTFYFGAFTPYNELNPFTEDNLVVNYSILEGGFLTKDDNSLYPDAVSSDLSAFESSTDKFYYSTLIEGGTFSIDPLQRSLLDPLYPSLSANITSYHTNSSFRIVDGGWLNDNSDFDISLSNDEYYYIPTTDNSSQYTLSTTPYVDDYELNGKIFIKNAYTKSIIPLSDLSYISNIYNSEVLSELTSNILSFELSNDNIFIETPSYLTISKLLFENGVFNDPKVSSVVIPVGGNYNKVSNRIKVGNYVYYSILQTTTETISSNNFILYPEIYRYDILNSKNSKIFPTSTNDITDFFSVSSNNIRYNSVGSITLAYNPTNNIYNISFLLKDQNDYPCLHRYDYYISSYVEFLTHDVKYFSNYSYSNILSSSGSLTIFLSSSPISYTSEELTL